LKNKQIKKKEKKDKKLAKKNNNKELLSEEKNLQHIEINGWETKHSTKSI